MQKSDLPEPWLRGTLNDVPAVQRAVLHALELAREDLERWCDGLSDEELHARPGGIAPVAFHLRHIARSIDRLLTYAEGNQLSPEQLSVMKAEMEPRGSRNELMAELVVAIAKSGKRIRAFSEQQMQEERLVGKKQLPTSVGGLLVHVADHTQRHVGQAITTAKIVVANR
ncbi:MAG TPA: DinB family protein [Candidatus Angelobacter sp.]